MPVVRDEQRKMPYRARKPGPEQEQVLDTYRHDLQALARRRRQVATDMTLVGQAALRAGLSYAEVAELLNITKPTAINWFGRLGKDFGDATGVPG